MGELEPRAERSEAGPDLKSLIAELGLTLSPELNAILDQANPELPIEERRTQLGEYLDAIYELEAGLPQADHRLTALGVNVAMIEAKLRLGLTGSVAEDIDDILCTSAQYQKEGVVSDELYAHLESVLGSIR